MKLKDLLILMLLAIILILVLSCGIFKYIESNPVGITQNKELNKPSDVPELELIGKGVYFYKETEIYYFQDKKHSVDCYISRSGISCLRSSN